jgi:NAD(P)-dependent dehydrogenase (short-subunit alcohol dehydrogenase family)
MLNREEDQGQQAIQSIKKEAGEAAKIEWLRCDLGNLKEVREVFTGIREREKRLDLVSWNQRLCHVITIMVWI